MKASAILLAAASFGVSGSVGAACSINGSRGDCVGTVAFLEVGDGTFTFLALNVGTGPLPCTPAPGNVWRVSRNATTYGEWYQALLLAMATDATLIFSTTIPASQASPCELAKIAYLN